MRLWCLEDAGRWGEQLASVAVARGHKVSLGHRPNGFVPEYAFMRVHQGGKRMVTEKEIARGLHLGGCIMIPSLRDIEHYESKLSQSREYRDWMPRTLVILDIDTALQSVGQLGYPFVSKSSTGSASKNVRLVMNENQARAEIDRAFGGGFFPGHPLGESLQQGYLIWQEFVPGNSYDYRVCKIGSLVMVLKRFNRPDVPFASGSGVHEPATVISDEVGSLLDWAWRFFDITKTNWLGIDVVRRGNEWLLLETTIGWSQKAYADCVFFNPSGPTAYSGRDIWRLTCDELERGVFG